MTGISLCSQAKERTLFVPFISAIVPVRNERLFLHATLNQLLHQAYPARRYEVIVVDGESTDGTASLVRQLQGEHLHLRLLSNPKRWSSAGRNLGVRAARGEYVVIVDGHCNLANRCYLQELAEAFHRSGADCLGRPQPLEVPGDSPGSPNRGLQRAIAAARSSWLGHHPASYIYARVEQFVRPQSVAVAYHRSVFTRVGLFDESFDACEDVEFNHRLDRAGLRCFFSPRLRVFYHPRSSLAGLGRQMIRYGRGRVRLLRKHPETFSVAGFLPAFFLAVVVLGAGAAVCSPFLALAYVSVLALYGLVVGTVALLLAARARDARLLFWLPAVFGVIHGGAGLGLWLEFTAVALRRTRRQPKKGGRIANPSYVLSRDRQESS
jgi:GT2 family glycosyltransferase